MNFLSRSRSDMPLSAAIIGLGVGLEHVDGYQSTGNCTVKYLVDQDPDARKKARLRFPDLNIISNAKDVFSDPEINIVSIASYDNSHFDLIMQGIQAGKHLFVEKPFCLNFEELKIIWESLKEHPELKISTNYILRKSPRFLQLREDVCNNIFGEIYHFEGDYDYGRLQKITEGWRGQIDFYSVMHGGGLHLIDLMCWITGQRPEKVCGFTSDVCAKGTNFRHKDFSIGLLKYPSGMVGKISANFGCVRPHFHRVSLYGTQATFYNEPDDARLFKSREYGPALAYKSPYYGYNKGDLIPSFVSAILGTGTSIVTKKDVFDTMSISFALEAACHEEKYIPVHYLTGEK